MPIIVKFKNGQYEVIQGETERDWELANRQGKVYATLMNNHGEIIYREDVRAVEFFLNAEWTKAQEDRKKAEEEKAAAEVERVKKLDDAKIQARAQVEKDKAEAALAALKAKYDAWHAQPWWRKVGRKCPVELPKEG